MPAVRFDIDQMLDDLDARERRQIPYAFALTANRTVEEAQRAARESLPRKLTIRQASTRGLMERAIRFGREDRADHRRGKLSAELRIIGQAGVSGTDSVMARLGAALIRQEEGGTTLGRATVRRGNALQFAGHLVPFEGLRTPTKPMPRSLYPSAIGLSPRKAIAGGEEFAAQYKGGRTKSGKRFRKNTRFYFATEKGIFVRQQRSNGESEVDAIWWFTPRVTIRPRLGFAGTFEQTVQQQLVPNFAGFLAAAIRTAR